MRWMTFSEGIQSNKYPIAVCDAVPHNNQSNCQILWEFRSGEEKKRGREEGKRTEGGEKERLGKVYLIFKNQSVILKKY